MFERDIYLITVLEDLGRPVTLREFGEILKNLNVPTTSKELSNWLQTPIKAGYVERSGSPGGIRYDKTGGYRYKVTDAGKNFIKKELAMVNDMLTAPSTPEPGITDIVKDKEQRKGKKEPLARFAGGSLLLCLSFLALYAGIAPKFRSLLEEWWTKQVGRQKPSPPASPETPQGLTV